MDQLNRMSLLWKAIAVLILVFALAAVAVAISSAWRIDGNLTTQFENRGRAIASSFANSSVEVLLRDVSTAQSMIDQYMELEDVAYVVVVNPKGEILAHTFFPGIPAEVRDFQVDKRVTVVQQVSIVGMGDVINVSSPILDGEVGHVHVGMDRKRIRADIWSAITGQTILLGMIFFLSLCLTIVLVRKIVQPLRKLTDYANALATTGTSAANHAVAGTEVLAIAGRADEVGQLAKAFRYMIDQVSAHEQKLRKAHDELEMRVQERTAELGSVNQALQSEVTERKQSQETVARQAQELARSNAELEQFAYIASHDLQEPLRKVQAFGDLLAAGAGPALGDVERDYLKRMQASAHRMQGLINDLLSFARVTSQAKPFVPVDLNRIAREVMSDLETRVKNTNGRVEIGTLPQLDSDPLQMRQLLQNLIGNALKFHRPDVPPVIVVEGRMAKNGDGVTLEFSHSEQICEITVRDNGIGFDEKYLDRIFLPFQRLHGRGEYEGTGMGLAICRKIVERHGGILTARSIPGAGTTFVALLPLRQPKGDKSHA